MKQPASHQRAPHAMWADRWNPYKDRATFTPILDKTTFNTMLGNGRTVDVDPNLLLCYCLDAPRDIPAGSTLCVTTIGGYEREEYNKMPREQNDWKAAARASNEVAQVLKKILSETE